MNRSVIMLLIFGIAATLLSCARNTSPPGVPPSMPAFDHIPFRPILPDGQKEPIRIRLTGDSLNPVSNLLFGQMAERVRFYTGEHGIESAWSPERGTWQPGFLDLVRDLAPTVMRYPGGGEADKCEWTWGLDFAPGRNHGRIAQHEGHHLFTTTHVGTEEFLALCRASGSEPVLVVNVGGYIQNPELGTSLAADWVEYCNAPNDGSNPRGGVDWAACRARNGHPEPHGVRQWELGNEMWFFNVEPEEYGRIVRLYAGAMLAVDPDIEFTAMGQDGRWAQASLDGVGPNLRWVALHAYSLWEVDPRGLEFDDVWRAAMSGPPAHYFEQLADVREVIARSGRTDVSVALNEWNCNTWYKSDASQMPRTSYFAMCGAAVFLHQIMRDGGDIGLACQSLLAGNEWWISTIRTDPGSGRVHPWPFHVLMSLYRHHHGGERINFDIEGQVFFGFENKVGGYEPRQGIPLINAVATRSDEHVYLHAVNASASEYVNILVTPGDSGADVNSGGVWRLIYFPNGLVMEPMPETSILRETPVRGREGQLRLRLPPHSVSVIEFPRI